LLKAGRAHQVTFRVKKAGNEPTIRDGKRPKVCLPFFAFNHFERFRHIFHRDIKGDMAAVLFPCAAAAADPGARFDD
jgi:hypothetical protein